MNMALPETWSSATGQCRLEQLVMQSCTGARYCGNGVVTHSSKQPAGNSSLVPVGREGADDHGTAA